MLDVVVLTDERYVKPKKPNEYVKNVLKEDQLILDALKKLKLKAKKVAWSDPSFDWSTTKYALFRTTWDYAEKFTEFSDWLMKVSTMTKLINSYDLIVWNLDKHYMIDLKERGVNIVKTYFIQHGDKRSLRDLHNELGWGKTVIKPVVSAAAKDTYLLNPENLDEYEDTYKKLVKEESMMLQPFQNSVVDKGEISLMMINGEYTHAVLKIAKKGDFRVQDDFGGTIHEYTPTTNELSLAEACVKACDTMPLYARVDMINDNDGNPAISELELVEPEMWFRKHEKSADLLSNCIKNLF